MELFSKSFFNKYYFKERLTFKQIGQKFNYSTHQVFRRFHKLGLKAITPEKAWNSGKSYKDDQRILAGKNHPRWKDAAKYYIDFKTKRKEIIDGKRKCELCKNTAFILHHIDKDKSNNDYTNLQPLCSPCHTTLHNRERGVTEYHHDCEWCGKHFVIYHKKKCSQKCCSLSCKSKLHYKEGKTLPQNKKGKTYYDKKCPICKSAFKSDKKSAITCSVSCKGKWCAIVRSKNRASL